jgi:hypothetical protein
MHAGLAAVAEEVGVGAAGVLKGVGEERAAMVVVVAAAGTPSR